MSRYLSDLRHSWRLVRRSPGLAAAAVAALAMGIGFTTTMFSIVHGGTRALPLDQAHEIVLLTETLPRDGRVDVDPGPFEFARWTTTLASYEGLAGYRERSVNLSGTDARPERLPVSDVTPNAFSLLGAAPVLGRGFAASDIGADAAPVVLLSHALWQARFNGEESVVGRAVRLDGEPHTVIGIMPSGFGFPIRAQAWRPLAVGDTEQPGVGDELRIFGRLRDGVTVQAATTELALDVARIAADYPATHRDRGGRVYPFTEVETPPEIRRALQLLILVVSLTLLVACANVANLLLARAAARARDTAIRTALGASRSRLVVQQLSESLMLAAIAAALGLALASVGLRFFAAASASVLDAFWVDFRIDAVVVGFASLLGAVAAVGAGLAPALRATRAGVSAVLQGQTAAVAGPRIGRLGRSLVTVQLALACGLLIVTATLVRASAELRLVENPFAAHDIVTAQLSVRPEVLDDAARRTRLFRELDEALSASPDFRRASLVSVFPGRGAGRWSFRLAGDDPAAPARPTGVAMVMPAFFDMVDAPLLRGRLLSMQDDTRTPAAVVINESFARRHFPDEDPLGARILLGERELTVVGVVRDLLIQDVDDLDGSGIYTSLLQLRPFAVRVMAQGLTEPSEAAGPLRRLVASIDPDLPVLEVASLHDAIYEDKRILDALATLFFGFGLGTVFLALLGLHAVLSFVVTQRVREFGVRRALGASGRDIMHLVLRHGMRELAWGLALGLGLAFALSRILASAIERLTPAGIEVFAAIALTLLAGAALALWRPVRRAIRLEPVQALRMD
jgi:predicted permease